MVVSGSGTYPRVVELLQKAVAEKGQRAVSRESGVPLLSIQRYLRGESEPTQATLEKLAGYFGARVKYLRGGAAEPLDRILEAVRLQGYTRETFNNKMMEQVSDAKEPGSEDYWTFFVEYDEPLPQGPLMYLCRIFGINDHWVKTGRAPSTFLTSGGIVGTVTESEKQIPLWMAGPGQKRTPTARCAKCGGELRPDEQEDEPDALRFWPCEKCCKG